jgi:hypothetical protein
MPRMSNVPPSPTDPIASTREGIRAAMAEAARRGPAAALERAILGLLDMLVTMLMDWKAGRFVPPPRPSPASAGEGDVALSGGGAGQREESAVGGAGRAPAGGGFKAGIVRLVGRWLPAFGSGPQACFRGFARAGGSAWESDTIAYAEPWPPARHDARCWRGH